MRYYAFDGTLQTPAGEQPVTLHLSHEMDVDESTVCVSASLMYNGERFAGEGTDELWLDALAALQKALPAGVLLKGCVTCKHGNLCPVGNAENQVFCMKDLTPQQPSDLFFHTEEATERQTRRRGAFACCTAFAPQNEDYYTYNDFFHYLKG